LVLEGVFPFNDSSYDPNIRGEAPAVQEIHRDVAMGAMTSGIKVTSVFSKIGTGLGEVWGIIPLGTKGAGDNEVLAFEAALSSTDDKVDITMHSSDATATDALIVDFILVGRMLPVDA
jgi:hypothetical protein